MGPTTLHLGPFTWDSGPGTHRRDPGPETFMSDPGPGTLHVGLFTWDPVPYMRDPMWNQDQIPLRGTWDTYINTNLGTFTLIQLSLNVLFSSAAYLFQTRSYTNLYNLTEE